MHGTLGIYLCTATPTPLRAYAVTLGIYVRPPLHPP